jgi:hypothetical protein
MGDTTAPPDKTLAWYLRSLADHDTHRGWMCGDGVVLAVCGAEFTPKPTVRAVGNRLVEGFLELGSPPVPEQVCLDCKHGATR